MQWLIITTICSNIILDLELRSAENVTISTPEDLFPQLLDIYAIANEKAPALLREIQKISKF